MAFYVPLGPRGILFRIGTALIGVLGSVAYRRAHRRRRLHALPVLSTRRFNLVESTRADRPSLFLERD